MRKVRLTPGLVAALVVGAALAVVTNGASPAAVADSMVVVGTVLGSVLLHEMSHAVAARRAGMTVESIRVSPLGGATVYSGLDPGSRVLRQIALAGPKTSFLAAAICLLALVGESAIGWRTVLGTIAAWGFEANLLLGAINLLPFGSLDGAALRTARRR